MREGPLALRLGDLAVRAGASLRGDPTRTIARVATLSDAGEDALSFLANPRYTRALATTRAGAVVLQRRHLDSCPVDALISDDPYLTYARIADWLYPRVRPEAGIHPSAVLGARVELARGVAIGPNAVIEDEVRIGRNTVVGAGCVIGTKSRLGADCRLAANVTLCHEVTLGDRVVLHPAVVIGADGFGMARTAGGWIGVPQVGGVRIGNDVEIGASTTIDRGAIGDTVIGNGVRLDNLIQVAHNVTVGEHTVIAACVGISGSTSIGQRCMIGGAACFNGHIEIGDDVVVTGMTMVTKSLDGPGVYSSGIPVQENKRWARGVARYKQLDELAGRVKRLEKQVATRKR
ncbi:MAG: UDP-3-O-(3-hydroxymyristoyl)glucosamine N-acyltransferase [Pseudomonadota bacterium]